MGRVYRSITLAEILGYIVYLDIIFQVVRVTKRVVTGLYMSLEFDYRFVFLQIEEFHLANL